MKKLLTILFVLIAFIVNAQTKGTFIDTRDNKTYKTIKIGEQTWMAENLRYNDTTLYNYTTILNERKPDTSQMKGICPDGWHIPKVSEWNKLFLTIGKQFAADKLEDKNGFNSLFNGRYNADKKIRENMNTHSYYWSSTERDASTAWVYFLFDGVSSVGKIDGDKKYGYSLRCIKDF
jgi:uncharacterized protein (TIGR02145 family)